MAGGSSQIRYEKCILPVTEVGERSRETKLARRRKNADVKDVVKGVVKLDQKGERKRKVVAEGKEDKDEEGEEGGKEQQQEEGEEEEKEEVSTDDDSDDDGDVAEEKQEKEEKEEADDEDMLRYSEAIAAARAKHEARQAARGNTTEGEAGAGAGEEAAGGFGDHEEGEGEEEGDEEEVGVGVDGFSEDELDAPAHLHTLFLT